MSKSELSNGPSPSTVVYQDFCVDQFQPLSRWIMIFGLGLRLESLIPAEAECKRVAMLWYDEVEPSFQSRPAVISLPILMIDGLIPAAAKELETSNV